MLLAARLPVSIKMERKEEARSIRRLNWEVQQRRRSDSEDNYLVNLFVVVAETGSWFWFGRERRVSRSHDRMGFWNQPSGPRMEVMRSILVHCTSSPHPPFTTISCLPPSSCSLYFQFFSSSLYSMHQIQKSVLASAG